MLIADCNIKEVNYCLRHHTQATLRYFNLKDLTPILKDNRIVYEIHDAWCGLNPKPVPTVSLHTYLGLVYMKDY